MRSFRLAALAATTVLVACQALPATGPQALPSPARGRPAPAASPLASQLVPQRVPVAGELRVPKLDLAPGVRLIGDRGGGVLANNGGGLLGNNAAGLVKPYALAQVTASRVEGARVFLADAAGQQVPGIEPVRTNADGRFSLPQVPPGLTFVVVAEVDTQRGKPAVFRTLVKVGPLGATTVIDVATTLVAVNVLDGLPGGELGDHNPARFQQAAEAASRSLRDETLPDFTDLLAVKARMDELVREVAALRDLLSEVKAELTVIRESLDEIKEATRRSPTPQPGPSAAPIASPAVAPTTPAATPATAAVPSATPSTVLVWPPPPGTATPVPACADAFHVFMVTGKAVKRMEFRRVTAGLPVDQSAMVGEISGGDAFMGTVPGGCPVWVLYFDASDQRVGEPFQTTFPPSGGQVPNLPAPMGPDGQPLWLGPPASRAPGLP